VGSHNRRVSLSFQLTVKPSYHTAKFLLILQSTEQSVCIECISRDGPHIKDVIQGTCNVFHPQRPLTRCHDNFFLRGSEVAVAQPKENLKYKRGTACSKFVPFMVLCSRKKFRRGMKMINCDLCNSVSPGANCKPSGDPRRRISRNVIMINS
jgi:hypothetical protein